MRCAPLPAPPSLLATHTSAALTSAPHCRVSVYSHLVPASEQGARQSSKHCMAPAYAHARLASEAHKRATLCASMGWQHRLSCTACAHLNNPCAGGRLVFLLEGGYDLKALGESVADTFRALLGKVRMQRPPCLIHGVTTGACSAASRDTMVLHTLWISFFGC